MAEFVRGFAEVAAASGDIVGNPTEDERSATPGLASQKTDTGTLTWANLAEGETFVFMADDGTDYVWDGSQLQEVTV